MAGSRFRAQGSSRRPSAGRSLSTGSARSDTSVLTPPLATMRSSRSGCARAPARYRNRPEPRLVGSRSARFLCDGSSRRGPLVLAGDTGEVHVSASHEPRAADRLATNASADRRPPPVKLYGRSRSADAAKGCGLADPAARGLQRTAPSDARPSEASRSPQTPGPSLDQGRPEKAGVAGVGHAGAW
jgi:hypothetical protein